MAKKVKDYRVEPVERGLIRDFIEEHHYSHNINGLSSLYCFALFDGDEMIGAMIYGKMSMKDQWKRYAYREDCSIDTVIELKRLVLIDDTLRNAESYFISKTLKWLKKNTDIVLIVSYADVNYGHEGVVYKASNFTLVGKTSPGRVIWFEGRKFHDKCIRVKYKGELKPVAKRLRKALEEGKAYYAKQLPKNVYVYYLKDPDRNTNTIATQKTRRENNDPELNTTPTS